MPQRPENKYTVHSRLAALENAVTDLRKENAELRVHLAGELHTAVHNAKNVIQDSIRIPRDGAPGRDGRDGKDGAVGPQGLRGDCNIPNTSEVAAALLSIRQKHAAQLARILNELDLRGGHHRGAEKLLAEIRARIAKQIEQGGLD